MEKTTTLGQVSNRTYAAKIVCQLFNECGGINAYLIPVSYVDTVATYDIRTDAKLSKPRIAEAQAFVRGMIAAFRSM